MLELKLKDDKVCIEIDIDSLIYGLKYAEEEFIIKNKENFKKWLSNNLDELHSDPNNPEFSNIWNNLLDAIGRSAYEDGEEWITTQYDEEELEREE